MTVIHYDFPRTKEQDRMFCLTQKLKQQCQRNPLETLAGERPIYSEGDLETNVKLERMKAIAYLEELRRSIGRQYMTNRQIVEMIESFQSEIMETLV